MIFTSEIFFLYIFVFIALYYIVPRRFRPVVTLGGSLVFALYGGYLQYLAISIAAAYTGAICMNRTKTTHMRRIVLVCSLIPLLGILAAFKTLNFAYGFLQPLGISFYTFQCAGYAIDVYRGKIKAERNILKFALFASFFPQIMQGPISRYDELGKTLFSPAPFNAAGFSSGLRRIIWGFFKKIVIADRLMPAMLVMSNNPAEYTGLYTALNILVYAVVLYSDFTGGIDITIGIAKTLGITVTENFDRPFYSRGISEYWRRWHITMGTWFKDYVFYPLSISKLNRKFSSFSRKKLGTGIGKRLPVHLATLVTWFATGAWHGFQPQFIAWGLTNGIVVVLSRELTPVFTRFRKKYTFTETAAYSAFTIVRTFVLMCLIRSYDLYGSVVPTVKQIFSMFTFRAAGNFSALGLEVSDCVIASLGVLIIILSSITAVRRLYEHTPNFLRYALCLLLVCATLVFGAYGAGYDAGGFIYTRF